MICVGVLPIMWGGLLVGRDRAGACTYRPGKVVVGASPPRKGGGAVAERARSLKQEQAYLVAELRQQGKSWVDVAAAVAARYKVNMRVAFRLAHTWSQRQAADAWNALWPDEPKTFKSFSYWELWPGDTGHAPSLDTLSRLAELYECSVADLLADYADYRHLDTAHPVVNRTKTATSGGLASRPAATSLSLPSLDSASATAAVPDRLVADFEALTDTYRRMDYRDGASSVQSDVVSHLRRMLEVAVRPKSAATEHRLLLAIGDTAQLAAWLAIDGQDYPLARSYCQLALSTAERTDGRTLRTYVLGVISYIHLHAGEGDKALRVLSSARDTNAGGVPPALRSWIAEAAGEAHAFTGDWAAGLRALHAAESGFDAVREDNTPPWLSFFNEDCHMARLKGRCLMRLNHPRQATQALFEALNLLPAAFVRERSGTLIDLAFAYIQQHEIEEACRVATEAAKLARSTKSERNLRRLRELLVDLLPWMSLDCVQDLSRHLLLG